MTCHFITTTMLEIYTYKKCSTCRNATKWLAAKGITFEEHPIRETPPNSEALRTMLSARDGEMRRLFNTSSKDYRDAQLKDKLDTMTEKDAFTLLQINGNLVKRPFLIGNGIAVNGFRIEEWERLLG